MMFKSRLAGLTSLVFAVALVGCGGTQALVAAKTPTGLVRAADEGDHQQMNAIVRSVLQAQWPHLLATADANHDKSISEAEYKAGRSAKATQLFLASFDTSHDQAVTADEYTKSLATDAPVEAFHHFTEECMSEAIKPFMADKNFDVTDLRTYMTQGVGLTADWPLLFKIMGELDLNEDEKLISAKGEGPAFMLKFARPQLQHELAMPTVLELRRK